MSIMIVNTDDKAAIAEDIGNLVGEMAAEITRLRDALETSGGVVEDLKPYTLEEHLRLRDWDPTNYYGFGPSKTIESINRYLASDEAIHEENQKIIGRNQELRQRLATLLERTKVPARVRVGSTGSGRNAKSIYGGWQNSLDAIPTTDSWISLKRQAEEAIKRLQEAEGKRLRAQEARTQEAENERQRILAQARLLGLADRYGLPEETDADALLQHILGKHRLLPLAHAMYRTRCDWSEGCWRVRDILNGWVAQNADESAMLTELREICDDFSDGRSFRDCTWNYDRLFKQVEADNPQLKADYDTVSAMIKDYD